MSRLVVAALVLLSTVGALFGAAAWNRGGEAQSIVLTERELSLPWWWTNDSGDARGPLRLSVEWERRDSPQEARVWLTEMKLRELGFTTVSPGAPGAADFYSRALPRWAWVAFEFDGPAWRSIAQRLALQKNGEWLLATTSRLVPIDAAVERSVLLRRYRNAPVIAMPAIIGLRYDNHPTQGPSVWGVVQSLLSPQVTVPRRLHDSMRPLRDLPRSQAGTVADAPPGPRYEVDLRIGRLGGAWIQDVRILGLSQ